MTLEVFTQPQRMARWILAALCAAILAMLAPQALAVSHPSAPKSAQAKKSENKKKTQKAATSKKSAAAASAKSAKSTKNQKTTKSKSAAKSKVVVKSKVAAKNKNKKKVARVAPRLSFGQRAGLHRASDPLALKSNVAFVMNQDSKAVLLSKNEHAVLPIASITKLMTALLVAESDLPLNELITITSADVDRVKGSSSRLPVGTQLTRRQLLHLALMSSENRAAHALGRTWPGGLDAFVHEMNMRARLLGMTNTRFVEPTGLSSRNQSSARDLATLVNVAHDHPLVRTLSTSAGTQITVGKRTLQYNNTNRLVKSDHWDIGLQKTGYISEAGRCLVMQAEVKGQRLIMVFLDSAGKNSRLGDAERVRQWVQRQPQPERMTAAAY